MFKEPTLSPPTTKSGPQQAMAKLGLRSDMDFALHLPLRYENETALTPVAELREGQTAQVQGTVSRCEVLSRSRPQLVVRLQDAQGSELALRFLNFYPAMQKTMAVGSLVRVRGELRGGFWGAEMVHPVVRSVSHDTPLASELTPVYPTSANLPQAYLRKVVASGLKRADLDEILPAGVVPSGLPALRKALNELHHPRADLPADILEDRSHPAWQRLKFDELLAQQLSQLQAKHERATQRAPAFRVHPGGLHDQLLGVLPFSLTPAQRRVVGEIALDLQKEVPMHRLLQGDVGSGKTVVAALSGAMAMANGWQCALMAPTEILAEQHYRKLVGWLQPLGLKVAWLTGSRQGKGRREMLAQVASGEAALVVGTHAVIESEVQFARLGLAIIDEQHRFGVAQRLALRAKAAPAQQGQHTPLEAHLLMMSATPIPRTLAMTVFADLDISTIDQLPPGRTPIVTKVFSDARRKDLVAQMVHEVSQGRQVYWVCPLIEESEKIDLQNATATHQALCVALPGCEVGLLHGRMNSADKSHVMARFVAGEMAVLVSTTVIEVGVDVPNASLMVIEHAERFGLSQLHQLRGRVGRGAQASVCVLMYGSSLSQTAKDRLKAMAQTTDGFEIARRDLEIRGPGEFLGARQAGAAMLRFADLRADVELVHAAHSAAEVLLSEYPDAAERHLTRWRGVRSEYLKA